MGLVSSKPKGPDCGWDNASAISLFISRKCWAENEMSVSGHIRTNFQTSFMTLSDHYACLLSTLTNCQIGIHESDFLVPNNVPPNMQGHQYGKTFKEGKILANDPPSPVLWPLLHTPLTSQINSKSHAICRVIMDLQHIPTIHRGLLKRDAIKMFQEIHPHLQILFNSFGDEYIVETGQS